MSSLRRGRANHLIPKTRVSEQVNVTVVSGHTVTCPFSDSTDEDSIIPLIVGDKTEGIGGSEIMYSAYIPHLTLTKKSSKEKFDLKLKKRSR